MHCSIPATVHLKDLCAFNSWNLKWLLPKIFAKSLILLFIKHINIHAGHEEGGNELNAGWKNSCSLRSVLAQDAVCMSQPGVNRGQLIRLRLHKRSVTQAGISSVITKKKKKKQYSKQKTEKARTCGQAQEGNGINFSQQRPQPWRRSQKEQHRSQSPFQSQSQVHTVPNATISILKTVHERDCIRVRCKTLVSPLVLSRPKQHKLPLAKPADTESQATNLVLRQGM